MKSYRPYFLFPMLIVATFVSLTACGLGHQDDLKTIKWREELLLSNGQIIVADLSETYRTQEAAMRIGQLFDSYKIEVSIPSATLTTVVWEGRLKPLALDVGKDGKIYLVTVPTTNPGAREYSIGSADHHAAFTFNVNKEWERVPIESIPFEIKPNLLISVADLFIKRVFPPGQIVDLATKKKADSDPRIYRTFRTWRAAPPLSLPLNVSIGSSATIGISIAYDGIYPFNLELGSNEHSQSEKASEAGKDDSKLTIGNDRNAVKPSAEIPLQVEIHAGNGDLLVTQKVIVNSADFAKDKTNPNIGRIRFVPGEYQITVHNITNHPEMNNNKIMFSIGDYTPKVDHFPWGGQYTPQSMQRLLDHFRDTDLLNHLPSLKRLTDDFPVENDIRNFKQATYEIPIPANIWNACRYVIHLDENSHHFWATEICGEDNRHVYQGDLDISKTEN